MREEEKGILQFSYKTKKRLKMLPSVIFAIIIFIISSIEFRFPPGTPGSQSLSILLILHIGEFGLFSMLLMYGFYPRIKTRYICLTSILYGIIDEIHQYFVPTRWCDIYDVLFDAIGAVLGVVIYFILSLIFFVFIFPKIRFGRK